MHSNYLKILTALVVAASLMGLSSGDPAPDVSGVNQDGKTIHISDYRGKHPVLLYFYPKDDTPGCTKEACAFRDNFSKFKKQGAVVFGVSRQDAKSHQAFRAKYHLPFDLLIDTDGSIGDAFGVEHMPVVGFLKRESVLIGTDGKIFKFYGKVDPESHSSEVLRDLQAMIN